MLDHTEDENDDNHAGDWPESNCNQEAGIVIDGIISDDECSNVSETPSEGFSQVLKLAIYHSGNCKDFISTIEQSPSEEELQEEDFKGNTAFLHLAMFGCIKCLSKLQTLVKDVNKRDHESCTALMGAASNGNSEVVKVLLSWSADVNLRDNSKNTALHYSVSGSRDNFSIECVHLLLQHHCNVNAMNDSHTTPLLQAIFSGMNYRTAFPVLFSLNKFAITEIL